MELIKVNEQASVYVTCGVKSQNKDYWVEIMSKLIVRKDIKWMQSFKPNQENIEKKTIDIIRNEHKWKIPYQTTFLFLLNVVMMKNSSLVD